MSTDDELSGWVGRSEQREDLITAYPANMLRATLDGDDPALREGDPIPPGWHWLYFHEVVPLRETGPDGHARTGHFMPPVSLPARLWAGNRMRFLRPLHVGERVRRESTIASVTPRQGRSGRLCFVTVRHRVAGEAGDAVVEEHDVVYREASRAPVAPPAEEARPVAPWQRDVRPSPVMLFRFSALTMNSHRIHYDRSFTAAEGHPGLLVHGPLMMLLLTDLVRREAPGRPLAGVEVRALAPAYDHEPLRLEGTPSADASEVALAVVAGEGRTVMHGDAHLVRE